MPVTVGVNNLSVVHASSNGVSPCFPDVCKTPTPGGPVPIPYPNIAKSSDTSKGTKKVKCDGNPTCVKDSNFMISTGDEAGSAGGGVASNKIKGKAEFVNVFLDVKFEGKGVARAFDTEMLTMTRTTAAQLPVRAMLNSLGKVNLPLLRQTVQG